MELCAHHQHSWSLGEPAKVGVKGGLPATGFTTQKVSFRLEGRVAVDRVRGAEAK